MTFTELRADPTFERHPAPEPEPPSVAAWITVAEQVIATPRQDLAKLDRSEREARTIGLRSIDDFRARKALRLLDESAGKPGRQPAA